MTQGKNKRLLDRKLRRKAGASLLARGYPPFLGNFCIKPLMPSAEKSSGGFGDGYSKGGF